MWFQVVEEGWFCDICKEALADAKIQMTRPYTRAITGRSNASYLSQGFVLVVI
jgi:hypothetical protein